MNQLNEQINLDMLMFIVNHNDKNDSNRILELAADKGLHGGTIMLGEGRERSNLLKTLGIDSTRRDLVMMIAPTDMAQKGFKYITQKSKLEQKKAGVALRFPLNRTTGISKDTIDSDKLNKDYQDETSQEITYRLLINISDVGKGEDVLDIIQNSGGLGGTIFHGRGAASDQIERVFNMEIEPEKDVVMSIVPLEKSDTIINNVTEKFEINNKNSGILFAVDLAEATGLFK